MFNLFEKMLRTDVGSRLFWDWRWGRYKPHYPPKAPWHNAVLTSEDEWRRCIAQVKELGLPVYHDGPKNWDSLAALDCILATTDPDARVLDAGSDLRAVLLPWLALKGYRHLVGNNLAFHHDMSVGSIKYQPGDITRTDFADDSFAAIACLSVVEHGVDLPAYFREMARILRPGGHLVTSTDYWHEPIDTAGLTAFGAPVRIWTRDGILAALEQARTYGLELTGPLDLTCVDKAVRWKRLGLDFTFLIFTLRKCG